MKGKIALVTGGAGFIGSHLCETLLKAGWKVRVLDDFSTGSRDNLCQGVEVFEGDVCDPAIGRKACAGADTVFHLAAKVSIRHSVKTFLDDARTNLLGTLNALGSAGAERARRFVFASSMAVYSESPYGKPVAEDDAAKPLSPYGVSKLASEMDIFLLAGELKIEPVALRLFNTYGTRQGYSPYVGVITIFITRILRGETCTIFGDGNQCRDFVHVADVAEAFRLAAETPDAKGRVFNIGTGKGTTVNRIAEIIGAKMGRGDFERGNKLASELYYSVPDISRARRHLSYSPKGVIEDRIDEVIGCLSRKTP